MSFWQPIEMKGVSQFGMEFATNSYRRIRISFGDYIMGSTSVSNRVGKTLSKMATVLIAVVAVGFIFVGQPQPASAYEIVQLADQTQGTPCDTNPTDPVCDVYEVNKLVAGDTFDVTWEYTGNTTPDCAITATEDCTDTILATATFEVVSIVGDQLVLDVTLTNDETSTGNISALGLTTGTEQPLDTATVSDTGGTDDTDAFDMTDVNGSLTSIAVDACVFANDCGTGSQSGALEPGQTDSFRLTLTTASTTDFPEGEDDIWDTTPDDTTTITATLDHFLIKFQGDPNSWEIPGRVVTGDEPNGIPEPSTLLLFGTGLLGMGIMGAARRRRERKRMRIAN